MEWYLVLLEYVKVLVTWPAAAVAIVFILRHALVRLIDRMVTVRVPGVHLDARQQPELAAPRSAPPTPAPPLPANVQLTPPQQEELKKVFQAERAAARLWEYRYLNIFLALSTQIVLQWFMNVQVTTEDAYDVFWSQYISDSSQRKTILQVLTGHHLVEVDGPALRVTEKGKEYVVWRGPLPALPPSAPAAPAGGGGPVQAG